MKSPKKLLWTLAGIAAALLLVCVGIQLFDGRSPQAFFVHQVIGFRALDMKKYEANPPVSPWGRILPQFRKAALESARRMG